ncbi:rhomboid family intramembrane serine protease [Clostridium massiliodielmoense]|uniref:rhomboid family intramembrane serine protease n=1 Tax=Clostridium massiliodielmoense TaxID=1776385 RepID=UPI0004D922CD|nr:rhomboid family intramembrane serine protease [Clostridium massiliodielmoense]KEH99017.1 membrane protein [Clostridium botulinum C/D str. BKT12695]
MNWLNNLERKFGKFAIKNLMFYIVTINFLIFILMYMLPNGFLVLIYKLTLIPSLVLKGELWRVVTYIFVPPNLSIFWGIFALYFYYIVGVSLEHEWGSFKFNIYYLLGMLGTTIASFISNAPVSAVYLNLSLFLAFARLYPDYELLLFFLIPVKVKFLAILDIAYVLYSVVFYPLPYKLAAIISVINYLVFFGKNSITATNNKGKNYIRRKNFKNKMNNTQTIHRCTICGITEKDDPEMEFRYCSKCTGDYEYCMNHLKNHEHIIHDKNQF